MRGLAICLAAGVLLVTGCGNSSNDSGVPAATSAVATKTTEQTAGVSAQPTASSSKVSVKFLCTAEGKKKVKGKSPFSQCVTSLKKLSAGKSKSPSAACKGLSKKKTKGTRGKSPYAVCVRAAATLMATKSGKGKGKDKGGSSSGDESSTDDSSADESGSDSGIVCTDADGNVVPVDSDEVEDCTDTSDASANDSSSDSSGDSSDSSDSSGDSSGDSGD